MRSYLANVLARIDSLGIRLVVLTGVDAGVGVAGGVCGIGLQAARSRMVLARVVMIVCFMG